MAAVQKISTCLWFDNQAQEAATFYTSVFKNSRVIRTTHYGKEGFEVHGRPEGSVMTVEFEVNGHEMMALNGGPVFKFNESVSLVINCANQEEIDYYWEKLGEGGDPRAQQCGWLKDKFGVSWQVVPKDMSTMMDDNDRERADRVMKVMLGMKKLVIRDLRQAYSGVPA